MDNQSTDNNHQPAHGPAQDGYFDDPAPSVRPTRRWLSLLVALVLVVAVGLWMGSGLVGKEKQELPETTRAEVALAATRVRVTAPHFEQVSQLIEITGKSAPNRLVRLRAATSGTVIELNAAEGKSVQKGDLLIRLNAAERDSQLAEARAMERQQVLNHKSVNDLVKRGLASQLELTRARASLESARARVMAAQEALGDTRITAPFSGLVTLQKIELGDYVTPGNEMLELAEVSPILVTSSLTERDLAAVGNQQPEASIELATGEKFNGKLRYIAPSTTSATNTFPIEIELHTDAMVRLGVTAKVSLPLAPVWALKLRPVQLELDKRGVMVIKYVNVANLVHQTPVRLVRVTENEVWVKPSSLPSDARVITTGSGFVQVGEVVKPVEGIVDGDTEN